MSIIKRHKRLEVVLFDMANLNRYNISSISIFCKIPLSISISIFSKSHYQYWYFSKTSCQYRYFSETSYRYWYFLEMSYRYWYFSELNRIENCRYIEQTKTRQIFFTCNTWSSAFHPNTFWNNFAKGAKKFFLL